jgi:hypothetical protein
MKKSRFAVSANTARMYWGNEQRFDRWRIAKRLGHPVAVNQIAAYLRHVRKTRGPFAVPIAISAIGRLYRQHGWALDIKTPVLQEVLRSARAAIRESKLRRN